MSFFYYIFFNQCFVTNTFPISNACVGISSFRPFGWNYGFATLSSGTVSYTPDDYYRWRFLVPCLCSVLVLYHSFANEHPCSFSGALTTQPLSSEWQMN